MAIFSRKENNDDVVEGAVVADTATPEAATEAVVSMPDVLHSGIGSKGLVVPRLSEKAGALGKINQYVFTVYGKLNKIEIRQAVEKMYGVNVAGVNLINVKGKPRRYGRTMGKRSGFKKAVISLTANSKKIDLVEPS